MRISTIAQQIAGLLTAGILLAPGLAGAAPVTFKFEADIVAVGGLLQPIKTTNPFGHKLTGRVTYDTAAPSVVVDPTFAIHTGAVTDLSLKIKPLGLNWTNAGPGNMTILNDRDLGGGNLADRFGVASMPITGPNTGAAGVTMFPAFFALTLIDFDENVFDSLALPQKIDLSEFEARVAVIGFEGLIPDSRVEGGYRTVQQIVDTRIMSLEFVSVPEPTTLAILGLGLAGLGLARRKRAA